VYFPGCLWIFWDHLLRFVVVVEMVLVVCQSFLMVGWRNYEPIGNSKPSTLQELMSLSNVLKLLPHRNVEQGNIFGLSFRVLLRKVESMNFKYQFMKCFFFIKSGWGMIYFLDFFCWILFK